MGEKRGRRGGGSIRFHRGKWACKYGYGGQYYYASFPREKEARAWLADMEIRAYRGQLGVNVDELAPITFGDLARLLVYAKTNPTGSREKKWRPGTHTYFNWHCKSTLFPAFEHRFAHEITSDELHAFLDSQLGRPILDRNREPTGRVIRAATVAKYENVLRQVFRYAVRTKRLKVSPMDGVQRTHVPKSETRRPRAFTPNELRAILQAADTLRRAAHERATTAPAEARPRLQRLATAALRTWAYFTVLAFNGLRQAESFRLRWGWIDLTGSGLWVREAKIGTDREDQRIPLSGRVRAALLELGPREPDQLVFAGWSRTDGKGHVGAGTKPLTDMGYPLARLLASANVDPAGVGLHTFRHTFVTLLDETGCRHSVQKALARHGREASDMTYRYQHPAWKDQQEALAALERLVFDTARIIPITAAGARS